MAHLGVRMTINVVLGLSLGCGGKTFEQGRPGDDTGALGEDTGVDTGGDTGSDTPTDVPIVSGFHSYTATITEVKEEWSSFPPPGGVGSPSKGYAFRFDFDAGVGSTGGARAVVQQTFHDPVAMQGCCGEKVTLSVAAKTDSYALSIGSGGSVYSSRGDVYKTIEVQFAADGRLISAIAYGEANVSNGDVVYMGKLQSTIVFAQDVTAPTWRAGASVEFASVPLPWDRATIETSESYEGDVPLKTILSSPTSAAVVSTELTSSAWGTNKSRGFQFYLQQWDLAKGLAAVPVPVKDLAGNLGLAPPTTLPFNLSPVSKRAVSFVRAGDDSGAVFMWGAVKETTTGCRDAGKTCFAIGPFKHSYCTGGSHGGIASRVLGSGYVNASVRAVAKRISSFGSGAPMSYGVVAVGAAAPGTAMTIGDSSALKFGIAASDGSYDSGWVTLTASVPVGAAETAVAVSGGGTGPERPGCSGFGGPPAPIEFDVTVYVDQISVFAGK